MAARSGRRHNVEDYEAWRKVYEGSSSYVGELHIAGSERDERS
jgi:hypothetical protein